jgi:DNA-binding transcriptional LysR family regulator
MQMLKERGVPLAQHRGGTSPPDWDAVRVFLAVIRAGSFRSAASQYGQSVNVLRRRIDELEAHIGSALLHRRVEGISLTAEGQRIFQAALEMEKASYRLQRAADATDTSLEGTVRLAVTEGLGTFWVLPQLIEFQRQNPKIVLDLRCAMHSADVMRLEADCAIQILRPSAPDLKVVQLGTMHTMPFASKGYLETYGAPKTLEELRRGKIVLQIAEQVTSEAEYEAMFPGIPESGFVAIKNNVGSAHYWAIAKGAGIGMLPTYAPAIGGNVVPLDLGITRKYQIWLTYHPDANKIPRVRRLLDWVIECFRPEKYPWFREQFIHPKDLGASYKGGPLPNYLEGFFGLTDFR